MWLTMEKQWEKGGVFIGLSCEFYRCTKCLIKKLKYSNNFLIWLLKNCCKRAYEVSRWLLDDNRCTEKVPASKCYSLYFFSGFSVYPVTSGDEPL